MTRGFMSESISTIGMGGGGGERGGERGVMAQRKYRWMEKGGRVFSSRRI